MFSEILIQFVLPLVLTLGGYLVGKRKTAADAESTELDNVSKALSVYQEIVKSLRDEISQLMTQLAANQKQVTELRVEMGVMSDQNRELIHENISLKRRLESLEMKLNSLKPKPAE